MKNDALSANMISDVVEHMNNDHADAGLIIVQSLGCTPDAVKATMVGMDSEGVDFLAQLNDSSQRNVRVLFQKPITRDAQIRGHLVAMTKRARAS